MIDVYRLLYVHYQQHAVYWYVYLTIHLYSQYGILWAWNDRNLTSFSTAKHALFGCRMKECKGECETAATNWKQYSQYEWCNRRWTTDRTKAAVERPMAARRGKSDGMYSMHDGGEYCLHNCSKPLSFVWWHSGNKDSINSSWESRDTKPLSQLTNGKPNLHPSPPYLGLALGQLSKSLTKSHSQPCRMWSIKNRTVLASAVA